MAELQPVRVSEHSESLPRAIELLDTGRFDEASAVADAIIASLTGTLEDWQQIEVTALLAALSSAKNAQSLARALWVASAIDEAQGRLDQAWVRCRRAIELYARLRMNIEEIDVRAARELASASARLRAR